MTVSNKLPSQACNSCHTSDHLTCVVVNGLEKCQESIIALSSEHLPLDFPACSAHRELAQLPLLHSSRVHAMARCNASQTRNMARAVETNI
eukprot:6407919-Amphidinium_carterae.1